MKKNILFKLAGLVLLIVGFAACDTADQDTAPVISPENKPIATFTPLTSYSTLTEGDTVIYNVSIDKTIDRAVTATARIIEGTIDEDDFVVTPGTILPYTNTASVMVIFNQDWDAEAAETVKFEIGVFGIADRYLLHPTVVNPTLDLTVNNYVSDVLTTEFSWYTEFDVQNYVQDSVLAGWNYVVFDDTVTITTDSEYEMDFEIYVSDGDGFDIADPWAFDPIFAAETGDNPESIDIEGLPDGEYVIWSDLAINWTPLDYDKIVDPTIKAPIVAHFTRQGTEMDVTVDQDLSHAPTIDIDGWAGIYYGGGGQEFSGIIANLIVAEGKFTIKEIDGTTSAPYKASANRTPKPAKFSKPRTK